MKKSLILLVLCALLLVGLRWGLEETASRYARQEWEQTLRALLPGSETFTEMEVDSAEPIVCRAFRGETGYVVQTRTQGYGGTITMAIGVSNRGTVTGLQVRSMQETWGLGAKALKDVTFLSQFLNTGGNVQIGENGDGLTGATVTSKAIARSVNGAVNWVTGADTDSGATAWEGKS